MAISEDALAQAAATLAAGIVAGGTVSLTPKAVVTQFNQVYAELRIHHAAEIGGESTARGRMAIQRD
jgi:hypothetical protein